MAKIYLIIKTDKWMVDYQPCEAWSTKENANRRLIELNTVPKGNYYYEALEMVTDEILDNGEWAS